MLNRKKTMTIVAALQIASVAAATFVLSGPVTGAVSFTMTTAQTLPVTLTDDTATPTAVTYTTMAIPALPTKSMPNGPYTSPIIGTLTNAAGTVTTAFAYDPTNGFRLVGEYTNTSAGGHLPVPTVSALVTGANAAGQVIGVSQRNNVLSATAGVFGSDAWVTAANGTTSLVGLYSTYYYTKTVAGVGTSTFSASTPNYISSNGYIAGISTRYLGTTTSSVSTGGTAAWVYNGTTNTEIGLTGVGNSYVATAGTTYNESVFGINSAGQVAGQATNYFDKSNGTATNLGTDGWVYYGGSTTAVGLYWSGNTPTISGFSGFSYGFAVAGTGSLPSNSQSRTTNVAGFNSAGQVVGYSSYYSGSTAVGQDAFVYTPTSATGGTYFLVGLTNGFAGNTAVGKPLGTVGYVSPTGARSTTDKLINNSGATAGSSTFYMVTNTVTGATSTGNAAWYADATGNTVRIGLTDGIHVNPQASSFSAVTEMTNSGFVAGYSPRFNSAGTGIGQDAWVYDSSTGLSYPADPVDEASLTAYTSSTINYLSESGVAVGYYSLVSGGANYAFLWSEALGFVDLGSSISPTLSAAGYQSLIQGYFANGAGTTIYATENSSGTPNTINSLVVLSEVVPEPASLSLFGLGAAGLLLRRRRSTVG